MRSATRPNVTPALVPIAAEPRAALLIVGAAMRVLLNVAVLPRSVTLRIVAAGLAKSSIESGKSEISGRTPAKTRLFARDAALTEPMLVPARISAPDSAPLADTLPIVSAVTPASSAPFTVSDDSEGAV